MGCAGDISSKAAKSVQDSHIFGIMLMVGYLGFDGFTSTWQDRMFKGYQMSVYSQILYVQACSAGVSLFSLVVFGQVRLVLPLSMLNPSDRLYTCLSCRTSEACDVFYQYMHMRCKG